MWFKSYANASLETKPYYNSLKLSQSNWDYQERLPHEIKLDLILESLPADSLVLDVGCWTGRLLSKHTHLQRFGLEPNNTTAQIAKEKGLKIIGEEVDDLDDSDYRFDLITMVDVFEHLTTPLNTIDKLIGYLKPNGKLLIVTGRTNCIPVYLAKSTYWYFSKHPDHLVFLNKKFVKWLSVRYPMCRISTTPIRHYKFNLKRFGFECLWLASWRFLNPNSPFKKMNLQKIGLFRNLYNVKEVTICTSWKDHYLVKIHKVDRIESI